MADNAFKNPILTPFKDPVSPVPSAGESDWGSFGVPLMTDSVEGKVEPNCPGIMKEVQFAEIKDGHTGRTDFYIPKGSAR